ncbi:uncharacterized protein PRCAT00005327001 [Priceomyces carsonii]|uniref:uncharacterized protein n=1 Tax=Priceomyces carsonii TaxID=28549 RepID=UPI002EDA124C|nr:unnamed protein product [Priceomyces carsonii]
MGAGLAALNYLSAELNVFSNDGWVWDSSLGSSNKRHFDGFPRDFIGQRQISKNGYAINATSLHMLLQSLIGEHAGRTVHHISQHSALYSNWNGTWEHSGYQMIIKHPSVKISVIADTTAVELALSLLGNCTLGSYCSTGLEVNSNNTTLPQSETAVVLGLAIRIGVKMVVMPVIYIIGMSLKIMQLSPRTTTTMDRLFRYNHVHHRLNVTGIIARNVF